jgi:hypothetical protein
MGGGLIFKKKKGFWESRPIPHRILALPSSFVQSPTFPEKEAPEMSPLSNSGPRAGRRSTMATPALTGAALAQNRHQGALREYANQKVAPYLKKALKDMCDVE